MKLVNATTTKLMNATTTKTHPPLSSKEGSFIEVWYELLEKDFFDKEDPKESRALLDLVLSIHFFGIFEQQMKD